MLPYPSFLYKQGSLQQAPVCLRNDVIIAVITWKHQACFLARVSRQISYSSGFFGKPVQRTKDRLDLQQPMLLRRLHEQGSFCVIIVEVLYGALLSGKGEEGKCRSWRRGHWLPGRNHRWKKELLRELEGQSPGGVCLTGQHWCLCFTSSRDFLAVGEINRPWVSRG